MSRSPEPRPALQKAPDGGMHPAAPRAAATKHLHPAPHAPATPAEQPTYKPGDLRARKAAGPGKSGKPGKPGKTSKDKDDGKRTEQVTLEVAIPKKLRKAVRKKAEAEGWTLDQTVTYVLRAWIDG
ncbi:MAG: hypothetical protein WAN48_14110 [Actinomycetes bacterium]